MAIRLNIPEKSVLKLAPFLSLTHTYNTGFMLSFLALPGQWQQLLYAGINGAVIMVLLMCAYKSTKAYPPAAMTLLISGGMSNLIDRFLYQGVLDYLLLHWQSYLWPGIFNLADVYVVFGIGLLSFWSKTGDSMQAASKPTTTTQIQNTRS